MSHGPSTGRLAPDRERDVLRVITDLGPLAGRHLAEQDARGRAAAGPHATCGSEGAGRWPVAAAYRQRLVAALRVHGLRPRRTPPSPEALAAAAQTGARA